MTITKVIANGNNVWPDENTTDSVNILSCTKSCEMIFTVIREMFVAEAKNLTRTIKSKTRRN